MLSIAYAVNRIGVAENRMNPPALVKVGDPLPPQYN
jgi:hypothetical protein